jgi:hypothetical protein
MRSPDKCELSYAIAKQAEIDFTVSELSAGLMTYVIDGGALLHRIPWKKRKISYNLEQLHKLRY